MKTLLATTVAFTAIAATQAIAADIVRPVVVVRPFTWTGHYIGLNCGVAAGKTHSSDGEGFLSVDPRGGFCGGQIGSNWQTGDWVFGLEAELNGLSMKDANFRRNDEEDLFITKVEYGGYATLTGRLGFAFDNGHHLLYVKAGGAVVHIRNTWAEFDEGYLEEFAKVSENRWGGAVGVGFESAVNEKWSWKLEYLAMDFGNNHTFAGEERVHNDNKAQSFKLGVNWRW